MDANEDHAPAERNDRRVVILGVRRIVVARGFARNGVAAQEPSCRIYFHVQQHVMLFCSGFDFGPIALSKARLFAGFVS